MRRSVSNGGMPSAAAAMLWLRFTETMPPRMISAVKAASFREKPTTAVVKVPNVRPTAGSTSKINTSCSSSGVPRMNQM